MRAFPFALLLTVAAILPPLAAAGPSPAQPAALARDPADGRLMPPERVADHVWVMRQPDRLWAAVIGNVTIIEQADGVVLVDSGGSIADGEEIVAAVAALTPKPIKAVAITHWHNDHPLGLPAIRARYPAVRIIATPLTAQFLESETKVPIGKADPELFAARLERSAKTLAEFEAEAANLANDADFRAQHALEAKWIAARVKRLEPNYVVLPTETVADRMVIGDPMAPVELSFLGTGNTRGDLIAWLPGQKIVVTGDIVVAPTPYGFTVSTRPWLETIAGLEVLPFTLLIPGHGRVQRDRAYLETLKWSMRDIAVKATAAAADKTMTKEAALAAFDRAPHEARFGTHDAWSRKWLYGYWLEGMFETAFDEARGIEAPGK